MCPECGGFDGVAVDEPFPLPAEDDTTGDSAFVEDVPSLPTVVICDIDGTVALKGDRSPFDESRVHEDRPNQPVIQLITAIHESNADKMPDDRVKIVFMSGRSDACRDATYAWLMRNIPWIYDIELHMRPADTRKDSIVKRELFDRHIRGKYNVLFVLDDRDQVVRMWREELGLTCLQVAPGAF